MDKTIRWQQRFQNFEKSFFLLKDGISSNPTSQLEKDGVIQRFEMAFELSWKIMKDYLESIGISAKSPRESIKHAFQSEIIENGSRWIEMLDKRNLLAHTYDEKTANEAFQRVSESYYFEIASLYEFFKSKS